MSEKKHHILCKHCGTKFFIQNDRFPEGRGVNIKCPKCSGNIFVPGHHHQPVPGIPETFPEQDPSSKYFEDDGKKALIFTGAQDTAISFHKALGNLGYRGTAPFSVVEAIKRLEYNTYDIIIIDDEAAGFINIVHLLNSFTMEVRRKIVIVLVTSKYKTKDKMVALTKSVNLVLNRSDINDSQKLIKAALDENNKFYSVYNDLIKELQYSL